MMAGSNTPGQGSGLVLVEAEAFDELGGWALDTQFMDQMGSPFLLAHGLGTPVADAVTTVEVPMPGVYRVWVRTRDWVAPWKQPDTPPAKRAEGTPGLFQLRVNGDALDTPFGTEGADWHWQDGGTVDLASTRVVLTLRDLAGFDGRCDAVLLARDPDYRPPDDAPAAWRCALRGISEDPEPVGPFDLVVVGGGIAGICAALKAARLGCTVALVQDRPVLGGNTSSEVCVNMHGEAGFEPYPHVGDIVKELQPDEEHYWHKGPFEQGISMDQYRLHRVEAEETLSLFLNQRAQEVELDGTRIQALTTIHTRTGRRARFTGSLFADCTGDGDIGWLAGATCEIMIRGHMGRTNLWFIEDTGEPTAFPRCPWALDLSAREFPDPPRAVDGWDWESGFQHDPFEQAEYVRDWNLRAAFGAWDASKNEHRGYETHRIKWMAYISGKRESRRLMGDLVLNETDLRLGVDYEDGCVPLTWTMDTHRPREEFHPGFEGDAFIAHADHIQYPTPYWLPYRCLYSRDVPNLFMAGRDISTTRMALGAARVQRTTGMMGEIVGMAASLCKLHGVGPRGVYQRHLDELKVLMNRGA